MAANREGQNVRYWLTDKGWAAVRQIEAARSPEAAIQLSDLPQLEHESGER